MAKENSKIRQARRRAPEELTHKGDVELLPLPAVAAVDKTGRPVAPETAPGATGPRGPGGPTPAPGSALKTAAQTAASLPGRYFAWMERKNREVAEAEAKMRAAGPAQGARGPPLPPRPTPASTTRRPDTAHLFDPIAMVFGGGPPQQGPPMQIPRQGKQRRKKGQQPSPQERQPDPMEEMDRAMRNVFG